MEMKKFVTILTALLIGFMPIASAIADVYPLTMKVVEVDTEADLVTAETYLGFMYAFYGVDDWQVGDCCSCIMFDNYTPEIMDDEIVQVAYSCWQLEHDENYPKFFE